MLTLTLRGLERDGLVPRRYFPEFPQRVEYELTALGLGMFAALQGFSDWLRGSWPQIEAAQTNYDARKA